MRKPPGESPAAPPPKWTDETRPTGFYWVAYNNGHGLHWWPAAWSMKGRCWLLLDCLRRVHSFELDKIGAAIPENSQPLPQRRPDPQP